MKFVERLCLKLFSIIILIISILTIIVMLEIVPATNIADRIIYNMDTDIGFRVGIITSAILALLSLRCLFAKTGNRDEAKNGIILENASGKLIISKESLENLIASVSKNIPGAESISSKTILDKDRNLHVYVTTVVSGDVMLKEISTELQRRIKEAMKKTADLEVKEVNIKIKNITSKKNKSVKTNEVQEKVENETKEVSETKEESIEENSNGEE